MNGDLYYIKVTTAPAEGSTHEYEVNLNPATGVWSYKFDGVVWDHVEDEFWKHNVGSTPIWSGEIHNKEDDMPGTNADRCNFTACQYKVGAAAFQNAALAAADLHTDDTNEWGVELVSPTALNIWDKRPNV